MYNSFYKYRHQIGGIGVLAMLIFGITAMSLTSQYKYPQNGLCIVNNITVNGSDQIIHSELVRNNKQLQSFDILVRDFHIQRQYQTNYAYNCYWKKNQLSETITFTKIYQDHNDYYYDLGLKFMITGIVSLVVLLIFSIFLECKGPCYDSIS